MKKVLLSLVMVSCVLFLTACSGSGSSRDQSVVPKLGDTVIMDGFEVTLVSYTLGKAIDKYDEYQDLVYLDVKVKNTGDEADRFNTSWYEVYGPNNTEIGTITGSKYSTSVSNLESIRPDGVASAQMIFPFLGYGTYYIEFEGINGTVTAEIYINE